MFLKPSLVTLAVLQIILPATAAFAQNPDAVTAPIAAPAGAAPATAPPTIKTAEAAADDRANEMICRKTLETGSLVKQRKICHTRSQWAYIEQESRRLGQQLILDAQIRQTGN